MILVFGGSNQGKVKFVLDKYKITKDNIYTINDEKYLEVLDNIKNYKCVNHLERIVNALYSEAIELDKIINELLKALKEKIVIIEDVFSGVVPIEKEERLKREMAGTLAMLISKEAKIVYEVKVGIPMEIKNEDLCD